MDFNLQQTPKERRRVMENKDKDFEEARKALRKYELDLASDGSLRGPKKPPLYGQTPTFEYQLPATLLSDEDAYWLHTNVGILFSLYEQRSRVLKILESVVQKLTNNPIAAYAHLIFMKKGDWTRFAKHHLQFVVPKYGTLEKFDAIDLGGLVLIGDFEGNGSIPLLLHEVGHCLYPCDPDIELNEMRATYFQILGMTLLNRELRRNGSHLSFPVDPSEIPRFASPIHKSAWEKAHLLFTYQRYYEEVVRDSPRAKDNLEKLLSDVRQSVKAICWQ